MNIDTLKKLTAIVNSAVDKKAEEIAILDLEGKAAYCDWFVLMNGNNNRQVSAIAEHIIATMKEKHGLIPIGVEGLDSGRWVLIDYADGLVHVFLQELRGYYDLDGFWMDASRLSVEGMPTPSPSYASAAPQA